jgi:acetyl esterase/lipase
MIPRRRDSPNAGWCALGAPGTCSSGTRIAQCILVFREVIPIGGIRRVRRSTTAVSTHPPFDPELSAAMDALPAELLRPMRAEDIPALRELLAQMIPAGDDTLRRDGAVELEERQIPGPAGARDLSVLILRPARGRGGQGGQEGFGHALPGVYHTHGGGMVMGTNRTGADELAMWVDEVGVVAVSVEYRLAPEHPHPAPVEDCYAGLVWTGEHCDELGIDPARLIIAGASAGGGLAAGTALMARDRGGPALSHQMLMCPMLDDRGITVSSQELDGEGVWDRTSNLTGWTALLGDARGGPDVSPYAAPARAQDLTRLPATFIDVGSVETFRDEDIEYAARLSRAGISVEFHLWPGGFHGFDGMAPQTALAQAARATRLGYLRRAVGS